ncbi:MAG: hypothetical protein LBV42_04775 [Methanobrevibacter sp.]|jgi:hypothetical protein|nr:hypothetical protein [Methanobrevibacter sp.]
MWILRQKFLPYLKIKNPFYFSFLNAQYEEKIDNNNITINNKIPKLLKEKSAHKLMEENISPMASNTD